MAFGIDDAIAAGLKVLDKFIPDPEAKAKAESEFRDSMLQWDQGQMAVNAEEAKSKSVFVAGWRPFVGWVCGWAFAYHYLIQPVALFILTTFGIEVKLPVFPMEALLTVLLGLLGLGGLRTYEKKQGISGYK